MPRSVLLPVALLALLAVLPAVSAAPVYVSTSYNGDVWSAHVCDGSGQHGADVYAGTMTVEAGTTSGPLVTLHTVPVAGARSTGAC